MMKNEIRNWKIEAIRNLKTPESAKIEKARWMKVYHRNHSYDPRLSDTHYEEINKLKTDRNMPIYLIVPIVVGQLGLFKLVIKKFNIGPFLAGGLIIANGAISGGAYLTLLDYYQNVQVNELYRISQEYNFTVDDYVESNVKVFTQNMRNDIPKVGLLEADKLRMTERVDSLEKELLQHVDKLKDLIVY